jgi:maltooligosyltrehalose trehalohydrolase
VRRSHEMPFGAECQNDGRVRFRLWAPSARHVSVCLYGKDDSKAESTALAMAAGSQGWFELISERARAGSRYKFEIDNRIQVPDPASRFQPFDVHGPSEVVDPSSFDWRDEAWRGKRWEEAVIYELHVGTFSAVGTFVGVEERLDYLADLGVTAVELMPLADFPGRRNWGYDGVLMFAPDSQYGHPDDLKRLTQSAHAKGLMVFLDVVYNHFGPEGNYLREYAPQFFTARHHTPWGEAINFEAPDSQAVRDFFIHNALYWLTEYHFDGLRLDAVNAIVDGSQPDILTELALAVRSALPDRNVHLVLENDQNASHYLKRSASGDPIRYDAQWNDDIHHSLHASVTGEKDGYYADYADCPVKHVGTCLAEGFDYQGQSSPFRNGAVRGEPSQHLPPAAFVSFLQNHDQVGNRAFGERIGKMAPPQAVRAAMTVLLLAPSPPLLFMGEEFNASSPFLFFCDFGPELAKAVTQGRRNEFARFAQFSDPSRLEQIPDPNALDTFQSSKLDWSSVSGAQHSEWLEFYRNLLHIRRQAIVPLLAGLVNQDARWEAFSCTGLLVQWTLANRGQLALLANLGAKTVPKPHHPAGDILYSAREFSEERSELAPWSAAWFLRP